MDRIRRTGAVAVLIAGVLWAEGCESAKPAATVTQREVIPPTPGYAELVEKHNRNLEGLERLWARVELSMRWVEDDGDRRTEDAEGHLMTVPPDRVALSLGKLGSTLFWAGCDPKKYWLFDLSQSEHKVAFVGTHERSSVSSEILPGVAVRPLDLPRVLGLVRLDPTLTPAAPAVEWWRGGWVIEPPGTNARLLLEPQTARVRRVDLIDSLGRSVVSCELSEPTTVLTESESATLLVVASRAVIRVVGRQGQVSLRLRDMTTRQAKIKPRAFEFETLVKAHKPDEVVDLDERDELD